MLKIAIAQIEIKAGRPDVNTKKMLQFIDEAKKNDVEIIIFPALSIAGRAIKSAARTFLNDCESYVEDLISASNGITIIFGNKQNETIAARNGAVFQGNFGFHLILDNSKFTIGGNKEISNCDKPTIYVNAIGLDDRGKTIYLLEGKSRVYNSRGEVVVCAKLFEEELIFIDFDEIDSMPPLEKSNEIEIAEIYNALHYGVRKFLEQIGMKKIVIGISGGIDSAVDAALYTDVLGSENVLLVNMPSVFNSTTTRGLSEQLAKNLGCNYMVVPIQESVDLTVKQIESTPMTFLTDGTVKNIVLSSFIKENIQARDRSARILATLAAAFGGGFTCNANKAETTVGYATMYGDSAGVLSALADLWKYQVYALAHYFNDEVYKREVIPQGIIDIVPSAELSNAQNVDEGKGDPLKYPYHDYLLRAFVEGIDGQDVTPEEILQFYADGNLEEKIGCKLGLVKKYFANAEEFISDLERWWNLFKGIAVAKRIQAPPLLAITNHAFGSNYPESQNGKYYTRAYKNLKANILN